LSKRRPTGHLRGKIRGNLNFSRRGVRLLTSIGTLSPSPASRLVSRGGS